MSAVGRIAENICSQRVFRLLCRFLGRRRDETHHALVRPASEKRQGTKSREVGQRRCSELRDLAAPCDPKISVQIIIILCDRLLA
jgi:hypothetical protein